MGWLCRLALLSVGAVGVSRTATAHGALPAAMAVAVDPADPSHVVVRTTFGLVSTVDAGNSWFWTCDTAAGFDAALDEPALVLTAGGGQLLGMFGGLRTSQDGCSYGFVGGELAGRYFVDLALEGGQRVLALSSNGLGGDTFDVRLFETTDGGAKFAPLGKGTPGDFLATSVRSSPSSPDRIYLAGRDGVTGAYRGALMRSDDRGGSWQRFDVPGTDDGVTLPRVVAVHPSDPDLVYLVLETPDGADIARTAVLVSSTGGGDLSTIFEWSGELEGFALSPSGDRVAVAGVAGGVHVASTADHVFEARSAVAGSCLTWTDEGLYVCAKEFVDGYSVGVSTDGGATFAPFMHLSSPCGPLVCPAQSDVAETCPALWPTERAELGAGRCGDAAASVDPAGCDCRTAGGGGSAPRGFWLSLAAGLGLVGRRLRLTSS